MRFGGRHLSASCDGTEAKNAGLSREASMTETTDAARAPQQESQQISDEQEHEDDLIQLVTFRISEEEFGVDILSVQEIIRPIQITMVPHAATFIEGVINLRGKVIPVINMRTRFSLPSVEHDSNTRIVVMEFDQKIVGILVDGVSEVLRIPSSTIEPAPPVVCGVGSEYIRGVGRLADRLLILLDLDTLLSDMSAEAA